MRARRLESALEMVDGMLVCGINKGLFMPRVLKPIIQGGKRRGMPAIVDPRMAESSSAYWGRLRPDSQPLRDRARQQIKLAI